MIDVKKSDMVSISDQEDVDLRIKQLIGRGSENSFDDSGDENQTDNFEANRARSNLVNH